MNIRCVNGSDYYVVASLINEWWGGRNISDKLLKLFFDHFTNTSFIAEKGGEMVGFLIGFLSQSHLDEAYIHFVGVHPEFRKQKIGHELYNRFFGVVIQNGRHIIRCVTSPVNKTSIVYHKNMGFNIEGGDKKIDGVSINSNFDGPSQDRVLFVKYLNQK